MARAYYKDTTLVPHEAFRVRKEMRKLRARIDALMTRKVLGYYPGKGFWPALDRRRTLEDLQAVEAFLLMLPGGPNSAYKENYSRVADFLRSFDT